MLGQGKAILWNISTRLAACKNNGRLWLSCNGPTVARPSWILPMIMSAPANFILCMAKSGKRDLITQVRRLTYI
jgi:hypothetical protein